MSKFRNLFGSVVAMTPESHRTIMGQLDAVAALAAAGMSPADKQGAAYNGRPTLAPVIAGAVATIAVHGPLIARAPWFAKAYAGAVDPYDLAAVLDTIAADPGINTVVLEMDSCGGTISGSGEIAAAVGRVQRSGKIVEARINGVCASAAYRAIVDADRITASTDSLVGGIGVYVVPVDDSAALAEEGYRPEVISSSPLKGAGADGRITPEYRADLQRLVNAHASVFFGAVAAGRTLDAARLAAVATGQVWIASEALALGLIDAVSDVPDAVAPVSNATPPAPVIPVPEAEDTEETTPQAAILPTAQTESVMDVKTQAALAALTSTHPALASSLVAEAVKPGATPEGLEAFAARATVAAKDAEIETLKGQVTAANAKADAAILAANRLGKHLPQHSDPGQGDAGPTKEIRVIPVAKAGSLTVEEFSEIKAGRAVLG